MADDFEGYISSNRIKIYEMEKLETENLTKIMSDLRGIESIGKMLTKSMGESTSAFNRIEPIGKLVSENFEKKMRVFRGVDSIKKLIIDNQTKKWDALRGPAVSKMLMEHMDRRKSALKGIDSRGFGLTTKDMKSGDFPKKETMNGLETEK
jgi:methyl coenzyme M reductase subunit D